ncbi:laminin [Opisthorchis viverrini]|uniref:Laminin n=1 Tax=Opisthorchis viverrini TaxID=6198 RepID=A0A1S8X543_OPIVI|nr:laminin [Opisthorchis viverrini]
MRILGILFFCFYGFSVGSAWVFQVDSIHDAPSTPNHGRDKSDEIRVVYEDVRSPCHSEGRASQCMPPFTNIAEGAPVVATSTCGASDKTEKFCKQQADATGRIQWRCEQCTSEDKFPTHHLTDRHQMANETYWVSGAVLRGQTINITLSLGKTFEVYYVSLQPYGKLPDAIALYKSSDFGKTWHPWQYFSTDCFRAFRLPTSNEHNAQISAANIQEVLCVALKSSEDNEPYGRSMKVIAFSTTIGRPSSQPWSAALVDWMTMTDLRVSLTRFSDLADMTQHDASGLLLTPNLLSPAKVFRVGEVEKNKMSAGTLGMSRHHFQSDAASFMPDKGMHFAFSDLAIGGRCKCNGHSNRCVRDRLVDAAGKETGEWGPLRCDCQHNTAGIDCEKCAPGYLDRPWARATRELANECKPDSTLVSDPLTVREELIGDHPNELRSFDLMSYSGQRISE